MKAKSASITLYHMEPGHHREVSHWHDADHKAEVIGTMAHVYLSQRWVTPPDWTELRPPTDLAYGGGEYINVYWSSGTVEEMARDFEALGTSLGRAGRMGPTDTKLMVRSWPTAEHARMRPVSVHARPGIELSAEAVAASTSNTGVVLVVDEVAAPDHNEEFATWHQSVNIPRILDTALFAGAAYFTFDNAENDRTHVTMYYIDVPDPKDTFARFGELTAKWRESGDDFPAGTDSYRNVATTAAVPSIGQYHYYD